MPTVIRACLFDAGNVFVTFMERSEVFARIAAAFNAPTVPTVGDLVRCQLLVGQHDGTHEGPYHRIDTGRLSHRAIYLKFLQASGLNTRQMSEPDFWALFCRHLEPISWVAEILEELHAAGIPLVVVSNGELGSRHAARLIAWRYAVRWADVVVSCDVQCKKSGCRIFEVAVAAARKAAPGLRSEEMVYVDDIQRYGTAFTSYFPGAHAICFNGAAQPADDLRRELCDLGLPIRKPGELPKTRVQPGFLV